MALRRNTPAPSRPIWHSSPTPAAKNPKAQLRGAAKPGGVVGTGHSHPAAAKPAPALYDTQGRLTAYGMQQIAAQNAMNIGFASGRGSGGTGFYSSPAPSPRAVAVGGWNSGRSGGSGFSAGGGRPTAQPAPHFAIGGHHEGFGGPGDSGGNPGVTYPGADWSSVDQPMSGGDPNAYRFREFQPGDTGTDSGFPTHWPSSWYGDPTHGFGGSSVNPEMGGNYSVESDFGFSQITSSDTHAPGTVPATGPDTSAGFPAGGNPALGGFFNPGSDFGTDTNPTGAAGPVAGNGG